MFYLLQRILAVGKWLEHHCIAIHCHILYSKYCWYKFQHDLPLMSCHWLVLHFLHHILLCSTQQYNFEGWVHRGHLATNAQLSRNMEGENMQCAYFYKYQEVALSCILFGRKMLSLCLAKICLELVFCILRLLRIVSVFSRKMLRIVSMFGKRISVLHKIA